MEENLAALEYNLRYLINQVTEIRGLKTYPNCAPHIKRINEKIIEIDGELSKVLKENTRIRNENVINEKRKRRSHVTFT